MITNLFSIFDPASSFNLSLNWFSSILFIFFWPENKWLLPNRFIYLYTLLLNYLFNQFTPTVKKINYVLILSLSYFILIIFNNTLGLIPYIFTASRHITFTLALSITLSTALRLYANIHNISNILIHLIPQGTPYILIPFIVLIETIRNSIQPWTLSIRLTANIIAGHLILLLINKAFITASYFIFPLLIPRYISLVILEIAVSIIQAYVFTVLVTLYITSYTN